MKKFLIIALFVFIITGAFGQSDDNLYMIPINNWNLEIIGSKNLYPTYLADQYAIRTEIGISNVLFSDHDYFDEINQGGGYENHFMISPGIRISLFKVYPRRNKNFAFEGEIGIMLQNTLRKSNNDMISTDGVYLFGINFRAKEWLNFKVQKHHYCAHMGDEYTAEDVRSVSDIDPNLIPLPVFDDLRVGVAVKPLFFLEKSQSSLIRQLNILQLYGDIGFYSPGSDFLGRRQAKPIKWAYMIYQAGAELEYYFPGKLSRIGGFYAAFDYTTFQMNHFAPNIAVAAGWILPQKSSAARFRLGLRYYNGRTQAIQFYNRREKYLLMHIACDI